MEKFFRSILRIALIVCICAAAVLLGLAAVLLIAPELFWQILHWGLILLCIAGAIWLLVTLIRLLMSRH